MDLSSVGSLLARIAVHYPKFKEQIMDKDGRISKFVAEEWHRTIGFLDFDEALARLDSYLKQEEGNRFAPNARDFLQKPKSNGNEREVFHSDAEHEWYVDLQGHLFDEEGREYGSTVCSARYYLDEKQRVCQMGMVIYDHGTLLPKGEDKWNYIWERKKNA